MRNTITNTITAGIQSGQNRIIDAASRIAQAGYADRANDAADMATATIELLKGRQQVEASVKALETYDDTLGVLLRRKA